ncbi:MAG TPA: prolipoprotein diacylglyceryl transferase [Terriglobales bacterium]|nr:prolipoprotein diacylglyceryl transferase [Terriglobales bacterium]
MFPRIFSIGNFSLPTYGLLVALGVLVGLWMSVHIARRQGMDPEKIWNLGILVVLCGIVGAKVLLIINDWSYYTANPRAIFSLSTLQAGGVFSGGFLAALMAAAWYIRRNHLPALATCDTFAPGLALGHSIGRLGCFAAGCCWGKHTDAPWGVTFTNPLSHALVGTPLGVPLEPTQLFESAVELVNFFILYWLIRHKRFDGQIIGAYMFLYGFARYFLEFLRDDPGRGSVFGGAMTGTQLISILLVIAGGALWLRRRSAPQTVVAGAAR